MSTDRNAGYAKAREDGMYAYVRESRSWGRMDETVVWHPDLRTAKQIDGYTRMRHTSIRVRRATVDDLARLLPGNRSTGDAA
jgi:hypothetical protein